MTFISGEVDEGGGGGVFFDMKKGGEDFFSKLERGAITFFWR